jgi:hypothetical protein
MILGMSTATFTLLHVVISLTGILSGVIVLFGMLGRRCLPGWTALFFISTILAVVTGFLFPAKSIDPPRVVGAISLVVLAVAIFALYGRRAAGGWRSIYVVSAVLALYLNVFVGIVQAFAKLPPLQALAPTGSEPPFLVTQAVVLILFGTLGWIAARRFNQPDQSLA